MDAGSVTGQVQELLKDLVTAVDDLVDDMGVGQVTAEGPGYSPSSPMKKELSEVDDMTCAICLSQIMPEDTAIVKGCEHQYCVKCIVQWAVHKEVVWCPQCKVPFSHLYTYRNLDGSLQDYPSEESVCLLKRAHWFLDHLKEVEDCRTFGPDSVGAVEEPAVDWQDVMQAQFEDEYEDDEVEDFYFSSAAGQARIVIGNRRWGEGGFVASGRQCARPANRGGKAKGKNKARTTDGAGSSSSAPARATPGTPGPSASRVGGASSSTPASSSPPRLGSASASALASGVASAMRLASASASGSGTPIAQRVSSPATDIPGMHTPTPGSNGKLGKGKGKAKTGGDFSFSPGSSPGSAGMSSADKQGRRARRNARRAMADARGGGSPDGW